MKYPKNIIDLRSFGPKGQEQDWSVKIQNSLNFVRRVTHILTSPNADVELVTYANHYLVGVSDVYDTVKEVEPRRDDLTASDDPNIEPKINFVDGSMVPKYPIKPGYTVDDLEYSGKGQFVLSNGESYYNDPTVTQEFKDAVTEKEYLTFSVPVGSLVVGLNAKLASMFNQGVINTNIQLDTSTSSMGEIKMAQIIVAIYEADLKGRFNV